MTNRLLIAATFIANNLAAQITPDAKSVNAIITTWYESGFYALRGLPPRIVALVFFAKDLADK